jgi:hypothetical protein
MTYFNQCSDASAVLAIDGSVVVQLDMPEL